MNNYIFLNVFAQVLRNIQSSFRSNSYIFQKILRFKQLFAVFLSFFYFCPPLGPSWAYANLGLRINTSTWVPLGAILAPLGAILVQLDVSCRLFVTHWASPAILRTLLGPPWPSWASFWQRFKRFVGRTFATPLLSDALPGILS